MQEKEAEAVLAKVRDKLNRHVSCTLTPELATGIYHTLRSEIAAMVTVQPVKARKPRAKKTDTPKTNV